MRTTAPKVFCIGLFLAASFICHTLLPTQAAAVEKTQKQKKPENTAKQQSPEKTEKEKGSLTDKIAKSESPIQIAADRMEAKQQERTVLFEGHVTVQQDDMTLTSNKLKVVALAADSKGNPEALTDKIDYIEAEGDVKVTQQDKLATSERAVFYQQEQKIVLYGHPVVNQGKNKIEGSLITIYLQQGRSIVEGGKDVPVKALLFPGKKE
jgi:lipopolysaccharide export system protein LptA